MAIAEALSAISASIGLVKELVSVDKKVDAAELKLKVADLATKLAQAQLELLMVQDLLQGKDEKIAELRKNFEKKGALVEHSLLLYDAGPNGRAIGFPYCQRCMDVDKLLVKSVASASRGLEVKCPQCKTEFRGRPFYTEFSPAEPK